MTTPSEEIDELLGRTLDDLQALPESSMRTALLCDRIGNLTPAEIAHFFNSLLNLLKDNQKRESAGAEKARAALALIVNPEEIRKRLGKRLYQEVGLFAAALGLNRVSRLFTDLEPSKTGPAGYDKEEEAQMEQTSLGERRALSKKSVIESIDRLLSDPDPTVIRNILSNPPNDRARGNKDRIEAAKLSGDTETPLLARKVVEEVPGQKGPRTQPVLASAYCHSAARVSYVPGPKACYNRKSSARRGARIGKRDHKRARRGVKISRGDIVTER